MRLRRAARCRLRASVALEAGYADDAREALEEARRLEPSSPELAEIEQLIASAPQPSRGALRGAFPAIAARRLLAGAAAIVMVMGVAGWLAGDPPVAPPVSAEQATAASAPVTPASVDASAPAAPPKADAPVTLRVEPSVPERVVREERAPREPEPEPARETAANLPPRALPPPVKIAPPPPQPGLSTTTVLPAAAKPLPVAPPAPPLPEAEAVVARVADTPAEPAPREPAPREPAPRENEEPRVRSALRRYEAAYSALNLVAAQAVWPTVDSAALGRAFDSLESQRVSLGNCDVSVSGPAATAQCAGTTSYTPKVGGGTRTEARRWTFELAQSGEEWRIVRAIVR